MTDACDADGPVLLLRCSDQLTEVGTKSRAWLITHADHRVVRPDLEGRARLSRITMSLALRADVSCPCSSSGMVPAPRAQACMRVRQSWVYLSVAIAVNRGCARFSRAA